MLKQIVQRYTTRILKDRALKAAILSVFFTAGVVHFQSEIENLLKEAIYDDLCKQGTAEIVDGKLKFVCKIVEELQLGEHSNTIKDIIIREGLTNDQKISLLKIKLEYIFSGESPGKKRFLLLGIIGLILSVTCQV